MRNLIAVLTMVSFSALAQTAPSLPKNNGDPLSDICTGFLEQSGQGVSGDRNRLCSCLVRETKSRLTRPEMDAYSRATQTGKAPPPAVMEKVMGIATTCLTEAAR
jgi:hypothetical protein